MTTTDISADARMLLQEGRRALLPSKLDKERVYARLQAQLPQGGASTQDPTAAASVGGVVSGKAILGTVMLLAVAAAVYLLRQPGNPEVADVAVSANVEDKLPPEAEARPIEPTLPIVAPQALPADESPKESPVRVDLPRRAKIAGDKLGEEAALLIRAEKQYHARQFSGALRLVDEHARRFPTGVLQRERLQLRERVLCGLGAKRTGEPPSLEVAAGRVEGEPAPIGPCEP